MGNSDKTSIPKLKGTENIMTWQMRCHALHIKDDYLIVIPTTSTGAISCTSDQSDKAHAIIRINIEDNPLLTIENCVIAMEAWDKLKHTYNPKGITMEYLLLKQFFSLPRTNSDNMEETSTRSQSFIPTLKPKASSFPIKLSLPGFFSRWPRAAALLPLP